MRPPIPESSQEAREIEEPDDLPEEARSPLAETGGEPSIDDAEARRLRRERVGGAAEESYLEPNEEDSPEVRNLKEALRGKDLQESIAVLLGEGDPNKVSATLDRLGISLDEEGKWRLANPEPQLTDPNYEGILPGSWANEGHLKAFLAGYVEGQDFRAKVKVVAAICEYLGVPGPEVPKEEGEEKVDGKKEEHEEQSSDKPAQEESPTPGRPDYRSRRRKPVPLSRWRGTMTTLAKNARRYMLPLTILVGLSASERNLEKTQEAPAKTTIGMVEEGGTSGIETVEGEEGEAVYVMREGDTVYTVVQRMLGERGQDRELVKKLTIETLAINGISDEVLASAEGLDESTDLQIGRELLMPAELAEQTGVAIDVTNVEGIANALSKLN